MLALATFLLPSLGAPGALATSLCTSTECLPYGDFVDVVAGWVEGLAGQAGWAADELGRRATPDTADAIVLAGPGIATVTRSGRSFACEGPSAMLLEASRKPFGAEPTVTVAYGGSRGEGGFFLPCAMGHASQPVASEITGDFRGAWTAERAWPTFGWRLSVGAPTPSGTRSVAYEFWTTAGDHDTFRGTLREYR